MNPSKLHLVWPLLSLVLSFVATVRAGERSLVDTSRSPSARDVYDRSRRREMERRPVGRTFDVCRNTMVPHLWTIFSDQHESHAWDNFLMAAGLGQGRDGNPHGPSFNDGDFSEVGRGALPNLRGHP